MPNHTGTEKTIRHGLNETNLRTYLINVTGTVANNDTVTTVIDDEDAQAVVPMAVGGGAYGAGDVGARTFTAGAFTMTSFDEATGTLVLTNTSGGPIVNPYLVVLMVPTS